jgi:hypothetical protein
MFDELESGTKTLAKALKNQPEHQELEDVLVRYRHALAHLQCLGTWNDWNDDGMDALEEDVDESTSEEVKLIATEIHEREKQRMKVELEQLDYWVDDPELLTNITNLAGLRIEQVCIALVTLLGDE